LISGKTTLLRKVLLIISGYSLAIFAGSYLVTQLCGLLKFPLAEESGIKRAGRLIGFLERFIVLTLVLENQYSAIAFVFTGKSIARFDELKNRNFSEYYLVGTFASMALAILSGEVLKLFL